VIDRERQLPYIPYKPEKNKGDGVMVANMPYQIYGSGQRSMVEGGARFVIPLREEIKKLV